MSGGGVGVGQGVVGLGVAVVQVNDGAQSRSVEENGSGIRLDQNQAKLEHLLFQVKLQRCFKTAVDIRSKRYILMFTYMIMIGLGFLVSSLHEY